jgi:hypothetical protein
LPPVAFDEELELLLDCEDELLFALEVLLDPGVLGVVGVAGTQMNAIPSTTS